MTSIEWLIEQCPRINTIASLELIEQAKLLHKQEIIDASWNGDNTDCTNEQNSKEFAEQETFGQAITLQNNSESKGITELSDEEIEKFADEELGTIRTDFDFGVIQGMKWYREQLKQL
jgi:hypothetical protein